jgi:hypothetical protein
MKYRFWDDGELLERIGIGGAAVGFTILAFMVLRKKKPEWAQHAFKQGPESNAAQIMAQIGGRDREIIGLRDRVIERDRGPWAGGW